LKIWTSGVAASLLLGATGSHGSAAVKALTIRVGVQVTQTCSVSTPSTLTIDGGGNLAISGTSLITSSCAGTTASAAPRITILGPVTTADQIAAGFTPSTVGLAGAASSGVPTIIVDPSKPTPALDPSKSTPIAGGTSRRTIEDGTFYGATLDF
jgi:hypothetical protein